MTQHTPGPWEVEKIRDGCVMFIRRQAPNPAVARILNNTFCYDEREANARLIAAAPELLEALRGCEDFVALAPRRMWTERAITNTLGKLRAAIAKAKTS